MYTGMGISVDITESESLRCWALILGPSYIGALHSAPPHVGSSFGALCSAPPLMWALILGRYIQLHFMWALIWVFMLEVLMLGLYIQLHLMWALILGLYVELHLTQALLRGFTTSCRPLFRGFTTSCRRLFRGFTRIRLLLGPNFSKAFHFMWAPFMVKHMTSTLTLQEKSGVSLN
jgi:hypothetical protein